jgi:hypothetical protein
MLSFSLMVPLRQPDLGYTIQVFKFMSFFFFTQENPINIFILIVLKTQKDFINAIKVAYQVAEISDMQIYPYSVFYIYFEQYLYIVSIAIQDSLYALGTLNSPPPHTYTNFTVYFIFYSFILSFFILLFFYSNYFLFIPLHSNFHYLLSLIIRFNFFF